MKGFILQHRYFLISLAIAMSMFFGFTVFSEAGLNDGDSITHYVISRYAWQYHYLFLDNWGKPFFILFSSPFAQFGYTGIQIFNVLCAVLSCWFCYRMAQLLSMKLAFLAPFFLLMTPVYIIAVPSGLTEIFFGLVLIISLYLLLKGHNIAAAIVISFLPYCRSEGLLLIPVIGLLLLLRRKFAAIPFLLTGFITYGIICWFFNGDFLWLVHTNPYHGVDVYGHGPLLYFVDTNKLIFGEPGGILLLLATLYYIVKGHFFKKDTATNHLQFERIALWGCFAVYYVAHSIFWYKGLFGSAGMWRVMAAIAPVFALLMIRGLEWSIGFLSKIKWIHFAVAGATASFFMIYAVVVLDLPQHLDDQKTTVRRACDWVQQNKLSNHKIYYSDPFTKMCLGLDPYENSISVELMYVNRQDVGADMPAGSIIIWEPGMGAHEDQLPLTKFQDTARFKLLNKIEARYSEDNGEKYAVYVFERE